MPQFTKSAIMNSFKKMLSQKPFEKITVKDIVEDCGINRKTFYYYFEDIYDLLRKTFRQSYEELVESIDENATLEDRAKVFFEFAQNNKKAIYHVYNSTDKAVIEKYFYDIFYESIYNRMKSDCSDIRISDEDIGLISATFVLSFSGFIFRWIEDGMKQNIVDVIDRLSVILSGVPELMIKNSLMGQK